MWPQELSCCMELREVFVGEDKTFSEIELLGKRGGCEVIVTNDQDVLIVWMNSQRKT